MFKFKIGFTYKSNFYGIRFGKKESKFIGELKKAKEKSEKTIEEPKVKILIQNHPVYEKYATMFREKVLKLTNAPDYSLVGARMSGEYEIFSYGGVDFLKVDQVEYLDMTDKKDRKKHYLTMKITINELASVKMSDSLPN